MPKILLISDTHSHLDRKLIKHIQSADEVWHAGDIGTEELCLSISKIKPLRAVFGNIDGSEIRSLFPEDLIFDCENVRVLMTHIAGTPGKYNTRVNQLIKQHKPQLLVCGHSHILKVMHVEKSNHLHMNPGACGVHGFHQIKTALRFEILGFEIKNLSIIELGARASLPLQHGS